MADLGICAGLIAPYYNLALVLIVIILFIFLVRIKTDVNNRPWKLLFIAVLIYVVEQTATVLDKAGFTILPHFTYGLLEMGMISIFIYMLLAQKEFLKKEEPQKLKK